MFHSQNTLVNNEIEQRLSFLKMYKKYIYGKSTKDSQCLHKIYFLDNFSIFSCYIPSYGNGGMELESNGSSDTRAVIMLNKNNNKKSTTLVHEIFA